MTALQTIIKEAKHLKAKYPKRYLKWTDYVKQASAIYAAKHKGKSPVGKKKIVKKIVVKKTIVKKAIGKKKIVKKSIAKKPTEKVILKKVHSAKATSKNLYNKLDKLDEAQHEHMSGHKIYQSINKSTKQKFINLLDDIEKLENVLKSVIYRKKDLIKRNGQNWYKKFIIDQKKLIKEYKAHKNEIKKLL